MNRSGTLRKFYSENGSERHTCRYVCNWTYMQLKRWITTILWYCCVFIRCFFIFPTFNNYSLKVNFFIGRQLWLVGLTILDDINSEPRIWFIIPNKYTMPSLVIFYKESFFVYFHIFGLPKHYRIKFHHCNFILKLTSWKTQNS